MRFIIDFRTIIILYYTIRIKSFYIILYILQNWGWGGGERGGGGGGGGGFGLDLFLLMVLIYYFSTFFRFIIVYVFNPRINKVRKKSKKGL